VRSSIIVKNIPPHQGIHPDHIIGYYDHSPALIFLNHNTDPPALWPPPLKKRLREKLTPQVRILMMNLKKYKALIVSGELAVILNQPGR